MMPLKYLKDLDCWNLLSMVAMQSFQAIAAATARNDPPPSSNRPWAPPNLPKYEAELRGRIGNESGGNVRVSIDPRKVYGDMATASSTAALFLFSKVCSITMSPAGRSWFG